MKKIVVDTDKNFDVFWKDMFNYREVLLFLVWKDFIIRYKQTFIGIAWVVFRPLVTMTVLLVFFRNVLRMQSDEIPFPLLVASGTIIWQCFSIGIVEVSNSFISNSNLVSKVYFPRIFIPLSSAVVSLIDFSVSLLILIVMFFYYQITANISLLLIPILCLILFFLILGLGLVFSTLNVKYRDFKFLVPFFSQLSLYVTPVAYNVSIIPAQYKVLYSINPLVGIIESFRWSICPSYPFPYIEFGISIAVVIGLMLIGVKVYRKFERNFADTI